MNLAEHLAKIVTIMSFITVLLIGGCGLKADPAPRAVKPLAPVTDIQLRAAAGAIIIDWSIPDTSQKLSRFKIKRSETGNDSGTCPGCPPDEVQIADLSAAEARQAAMAPDKGSYQDASVKPGRVYRYRVVACDSKDICSEASRPRELLMPKTP